MTQGRLPLTGTFVKCETASETFPGDLHPLRQGVYYEWSRGPFTPRKPLFRQSEGSSDGGLPKKLLRDSAGKTLLRLPRVFRVSFPSFPQRIIRAGPSPKGPQWGFQMT